MPQENYVLRCYSCATFQVHIVKKAKKWQCKMCNAKQSFMKHYGRGNGKDCRMQVMKLNELQMQNQVKLIQDQCQEIGDESEHSMSEIRNQEPALVKKPAQSKWLQFLDSEPENDDDDDDENVVNNDNHQIKPETYAIPTENTIKKRKISDEKESEENLTAEFSFSFGETSKFDLNDSETFDFKVEFETPLQLPKVIDSNKPESERKKRKFNEYSSETEPNPECYTEPGVTNRSNIFCSDPSDLDDLININF